MINAFVLSIKGRIDETRKAEGSKPWQFNNNRIKGMIAIQSTV